MASPPSHNDRLSAERDHVLSSLSPDAAAKMRAYVDLLLRWQRTINLIAPSTIPDLWTRHVGDSLQVQRAVPDARRWLDLGSGGGLPGLVTAIVLTGERGSHVTLVESDKRKSAFLRTAIGELALSASVHVGRIETFVETTEEQFDAISARALAPPAKLLLFAHRFLQNGAIGVFPQGEHAANELTMSESGPSYSFKSVPSSVRAGSSLLIVRAATAERPQT